MGLCLQSINIKEDIGGVKLIVKKLTIFGEIRSCVNIDNIIFNEKYIINNNR